MSPLNLMSKKYKKKDNSLSNPHDLLVKSTLSNPKYLKEFANAHFPPEALEKIDHSSLNLTNKSYVSEDMKEFHNDLVFSFTMQGEPGYAYCILEHMSIPDYLMALRLIKYLTNLIEDHLDGKDEKTPWPIIIPICLYHHPDEKVYPFSTKTYDYFSNPALAEKIGIFTQFYLKDYNHISDEQIEQHGSISTMEKLLKYSRSRDAFKELAKELERSGSVILLRRGYWQKIFIYAINVIAKNDKNSEKTLVDLFKDKLNIEEDTMLTIAQSIERRGVKRGVQQTKLATAKNMLKKGYSIQAIQEITGLNKEAVEKLKKD
jgi:recombination-promoting nuclease RpnB